MTRGVNGEAINEYKWTERVTANIRLTVIIQSDCG